ncbi:CPBP family intramembrane metalloprotease [Brevibacillus sp. SYP-B805]|nr:CPBP family intramembrane metalloprotease [Brevibacillus sp. SYP-B805]
MKRKGSVLLFVCYGFCATLALVYGLLVRQSLLATFVVFHVAVLLGIPLAHGWREGDIRRHWREAWTGLRGGTAGLAIGAASGVLLGALAMGGLWLLIRAGIQPERVRAILVHWGLTEQGKWLFAGYMIVVNSFLEELMWRGFVLQRLTDVLPRVQAMLLSSFFFALYHLILGTVLFGWRWGLLATVLVFWTGLFWAWMKHRYPSVYPTWISHLVADVGIMVALFLWILG